MTARTWFRIFWEHIPVHGWGLLSKYVVLLVDRHANWLSVFFEGVGANDDSITLSFCTL